MDLLPVRLVPILGDAHLGNLQQVQEVYGRGQTWRFTELWYGQKYFDGKLDWKIGKFPEGDDFASFSCEFMNLTFCGAAPGDLVGCAISHPCGAFDRWRVILVVDDDYRVSDAVATCF